ncbi:DUF4870 domain-containing protein [Candidatus Woesearchaeota archaeon]|nr:DUF4870 domain-containing protein [Candidatus Woesearchaeota archaeon]
MATKKVKNDSNIWAFLGVFLGWIGFLIILLTRKEDKFAMFYAKYGLILSIAWVVVLLVGMLPIIGWLVYIVGGIILLIVWVISFISALSGKEKRFPILSDLADKITI